MTRVSQKFTTVQGAGTSIKESPTGSVNGSNVTFTLSQTPISGSLSFYVNGIIQKETDHYSLSGSTITMTTAPTEAQDLYATYRY